MIPIREEFEKAFESEFGFSTDPDGCGVFALWAARWMAERLEKEAGDYCITAGDIRQLAKELEK